MNCPCTLYIVRIYIYIPKTACIGPCCLVRAVAGLVTINMTHLMNIMKMVNMMMVIMMSKSVRASS